MQLRSMMSAYDEISHFLHDARLVDFEWSPELAQIRLTFDCLRRNIDGSRLEDASVDLILSDVDAIAAYYSPAAIEVRPSQFKVGSPLMEADLRSWSKRPAEVAFCLDSAQQAFHMQTSCRIDWLFGESRRQSRDAGFAIHVLFDVYSYAPDSVVTGIFIQCGGIQPTAGGVPLELDEWRRQYAAWWEGWQQYWANQGDDEDEAQATKEDVLIPAGEASGVDLSYVPPREPAFLVDEADVPAELLTPIRDFHEGHHSRDWQKLAGVYPNLDVDATQRAHSLEQRYQGDEFGRWVYVRRIDSFWVEGNRACVVIRGIEHAMPDEGDPARNEETVITYGLKRLGRDWIIVTWSHGWPRHGSAPILDTVQSWREGWALED